MSRFNRPEARMIKGNSYEEKFASVEKVLLRLDRHISKNVDVFIPPIPISLYASEVSDSGDIIRFMSPVAGNIRKAILSIDEIIGKAKNVPITIDFITKSKLLSHTVSSIVGTKIITIDAPISVGDKIVVTGKKGDGDGTPAIKGIWVSILIDININEAHVKTVMMDDIISLSVDEEEL